MHIFAICVQSGFYGMYAWYKVSQLTGLIITVLGGHRAPKDSYYTKLAYDIAHQCVARGKAVLTGGGAGIMEAANCGAFEQESGNKYNHLHTYGIGVHNIDKNYHNPCSRIVYVNTFFIRKWLFINFSSAFIFLPGGVGTADELFDVLNMMDTQQIKPVPVILVDDQYWKLLIEWLTQASLEHNLINPQWLHRFHTANSVDEAMAIIDTVTAIKR